MTTTTTTMTPPLFDEHARRLTARPTTTITRGQLLGSGLINLGRVVQQLPSQGNAINEQANNGGDGTNRVNLRGLGTVRTRTLINGRSMVHGGTGADASADLSVIPIAMIERIDVLKDGDSAVFGSGAIGGVVNIITRKNLDGTEASLYTGSSSRGDGNRWDASVVTGVSSSKGHITAAISFQRQEPVFAGDRAFSAHDKDFDFETRVETNTGSSSIPGGRINTRALDSNGDGRPDAPINLCGLTAAGVPIQYCRREDSAWVPFIFPDDLYNYMPENYLITPSQRASAFVTGERKLTYGMRGFFEALFTRAETGQRLAPEPFVSAAPISAQSVYNPLGVGVLGYNRRLVELGPRTSEQETNTLRLVVGARGEIDRRRLDDWSWELSYNLGRSSATQRNRGNLRIDHLTNALGPSFFDANGVARCGTPGNEIAGCVPLNLLAGADANAVTREMIDYSGYSAISSGFNQEQTLLAKLSGQLLRLPGGGGLSFTISADHRRESGGFTPDELTAEGGTTGNAAAPVDGTVNVAEGHAEVTLVPVVGDGGTRLIELGAAARAFRYDTFGSGTSWRASALVRSGSGLAARASLSNAYRAPSIAEAFSGSLDSFPQVDDPCDTTPPGFPGPITLPPDVAARCAAQGVPPNASFGTAQQRTIVGGNRDAHQETARVFTAGVVLEPSFIQGLTISADYFRTEVKDALQLLGAQAILASCYNRGLDEYCDKVHRDPNLGGAIDFIDDRITNAGGTTTSGVDVAASYEHGSGRSRFRHAADATFLGQFDLDNTVQIFRAKGNYDFGVYPDLKLNVTSEWERDGLGAGANLRFVSSFDECNGNGCNSLEEPIPSPGAAVVGGGSGNASSTEDEPNRRTVDSNLTVDVFGSRSWRGRTGETRLTVGVNNVFDQDPPLIYSGFHGDSDSTTYDYMGRFFYARLTQQF